MTDNQRVKFYSQVQLLLFVSKSNWVRGIREETKQKKKESWLNPVYVNINTTVLAESGQGALVSPIYVGDENLWV